MPTANQDKRENERSGREACDPVVGEQHRKRAEEAEQCRDDVRDVTLEKAGERAGEGRSCHQLWRADAAPALIADDVDGEVGVDPVVSPTVVALAQDRDTHMRHVEAGEYAKPKVTAVQKVVHRPTDGRGMQELQRLLCDCEGLGDQNRPSVGREDPAQRVSARLWRAGCRLRQGCVGGEADIGHGQLLGWRAPFFERVAPAGDRECRAFEYGLTRHVAKAINSLVG